MELKLKAENETLKTEKAFNRTTMELKRIPKNVFCIATISFNRTIMELKHGQKTR